MLLLCSSNPGRVGHIFLNAEGKAGALIPLMVKARARPGCGSVKLIKWAEKWGCPGIQEPGRTGRCFSCFSSSELAPNPWFLNLRLLLQLGQKDSLDHHPDSLQEKQGSAWKQGPNPQGTEPCWGGWRESRFHEKSVVSRWGQCSRNGQTDRQMGGRTEQTDGKAGSRGEGSLRSG